MSRNGSGVYSLSDTISPGDPQSSTVLMGILEDIESAMSDSVAKNGETTLTGPLKFADGSASAPSVTFGSDTNTGFFRKSADVIGIACGGSEVGSFSASGFSAIPAGVFFPYAGTSAPSGYLFCYGQAISRTTYATLFTAIGTTWGAGDGSTTFNVPDLRGRVVAGKDDMGGTSANRLTNQTGGLNGDTLGATGGSETHTLTTAQMPSHTHTGTTASNGDHTHSVSFSMAVAAGGGSTANSTSATDDVTGSGGAHTHTFTTASTGDGGAHNNVQPTIIGNYIIKT